MLIRTLLDWTDEKDTRGLLLATAGEGIRVLMAPAHR